MVVAGGAAFGRERLRLWPPSLLVAARKGPRTPRGFSWRVLTSRKRLCDRKFCVGFLFSLLLCGGLLCFCSDPEDVVGVEFEGWRLGAQGRVATFAGEGLTRVLAAVSIKPHGLRFTGEHREGDLTPLNL